MKTDGRPFIRATVGTKVKLGRNEDGGVIVVECTIQNLSRRVVMVLVVMGCVWCWRGHESGSALKRRSLDDDDWLVG